MRMSRNVLLVFLMSFLCVVQLSAQPLVVHAITEPIYETATLTSYGSGTAEDPWRIYYLKQFAELAIINTTQTHPYGSAHYALMNDLDFRDANADGVLNDPFVALGSDPGSNWVPIGSSANYPAFAGSFNGNSYTIYNLMIQSTDFSIGLFGMLYGSAVIENLHLVDAYVEGDNTVGGIAGIMEEGARLNNVSVDGDIKGTSCVGGLVGAVFDGGNITNSGSTASVTGIVQNVGGLVGYMRIDRHSMTISNAYYSGILGANETTTNIGGIVGNYRSTDPTLTLENVYVKTNRVNLTDNGIFIGTGMGFLSIINAHYQSDMTDFVGIEWIGETFENINPYSDNTTLMAALNTWVLIHQTTPESYYPWRISPNYNNGYPIINDTIATYVGAINYNTLGASVSVDPNFRVYAPKVKTITVRILDAQVSDLLVSPMTVSGISTLFEDGMMTLYSATPVSGLIFQNMLRVLEFSTSGTANTRVIEFSFFDGTENVIATKRITMPGLSVMYDSVDQDSGTMPVDPIRYWSGSTATILGNIGNIFKTGHTFAGWTDGVNNYLPDDTFTITHDITLSALWSTNNYTVTFTDDDGTILSTQSVLFGQEATPPLTNPTKAGYNFVGWDNDTTFISAETMFKACYDPITTSFTDDNTGLMPVINDFADVVDFTPLELDPNHVLSIRLAFALKVHADLSVAEKAKMDAYLASLGPNKMIECFLFDISLFKSINQQEVAVTLTNRPIVITITIPEAFHSVKFKLFRMHTDGDGMTTLVSLPYTYDPLTFKATFSSDQFSVFGLAYGEAKLPDTGVRSDNLGLVALGLSLLLGLISIKKQQKSK